MAIRRGESHGSTWKVAYADFVSAMMALFLVLWIAAQSQEVKESVAGHFRATALLKHERSGIGTDMPITHVIKNPKQRVPPEHSPSGDPGGAKNIPSKSLGDKIVRESAATIMSFLKRNNADPTEEDAFRLEFMNDGFRIDAIDRTKRPFFDKGTANLTEYGQWVLKIVAWEIESNPFRIEIEGHTQGDASSSESGGNDWDLSTARALACKRYLEEKGVKPDQFWRIAGYANKQPLDADQPNLESNRRITVMIRLDPNADMDEARRLFKHP